MSILTTTGMTNYINTYKQDQVNKRVVPLSNKKANLSSIVSIWGNVSSKLSNLKSIINDLAQTGTSSVFQGKSATSSDSTIINATATSTATPAVFNIKVNQLTKNDILMSNQVASSDISSLGNGAQTHTIKVNDGTYYSTVDISLSAVTSGNRLSKDVMTSLQSAINGDYYAKIIDGDSLAFTPITLNDTNNKFKINLSGSTKEITLTNQTYNTYNDLLNEIINKVNSANIGVTATNESGKLKLSSNIKGAYIAVDTTTDIAQSIGFDDSNKYKAFSDLVSASVFTPSTDNYRLSLMAKSSGSGKLNISDDTGSSILQSLGITSAIINDRNAKLNNGQTTAGWVYLGSELNAKLEFNGVNVEKSSNTINDLVSGVTFDLKSTSGTTQTIQINQDQTSITNKINDFITKFNDVYSYVKNNMSSGSTSGRGKLAGDQTAYALIDLLKKTANIEVGSNSDIKTLKDMGIVFDIDTGLKISDTTKFNNAISTKINEVEAFFNKDVTGTAINETNYTNYGFAQQFKYNVIAPFLDGRTDSNGNTRTALITNLTTSYNKNISQLSNSIDTLTKRIDKEADTMKSRLTKMQNQLAAMINSQNSFNSFFGGVSSSSLL